MALGWKNNSNQRPGWKPKAGPSNRQAPFKHHHQNFPIVQLTKYFKTLLRYSSMNCDVNVKKKCCQIRLQILEMVQLNFNTV